MSKIKKGDLVRIKKAADWYRFSKMELKAIWRIVNIEKTNSKSKVIHLSPYYFNGIITGLGPSWEKRSCWKSEIALEKLSMAEKTDLIIGVL